jgi:8-oxo-dGTP diphosphatase
MIKQCHVGVKGVVCVDDRCLLLQRKSGDSFHWDIPGGRIDDNETIEETLKRELAEELPSLKNYSVGELLHACRLSHDIEGGTGLILIFYKINAEPFEVALSEEHQDYRWLNKTEISELLKKPIIEQGYYEALKKAFETT